MSSLRNKVQLIGNVGATPEITDLESGKKVTRFPLATNDFYKNAKGEKYKVRNGTILWLGVKLLKLLKSTQ